MMTMTEITATDNTAVLSEMMQTLKPGVICFSMRRHHGDLRFTAFNEHYQDKKVTGTLHKGAEHADMSDAEFVEYSIMDFNSFMTWFWHKRWDNGAVEGQFMNTRGVEIVSHKRIEDADGAGMNADEVGRRMWR